MKFKEPIPVTQVAARIGAEVIGDKNLSVTGINEIHHVEAGDITFVDVKKYFDKALRSAASVIILNEKTKAPRGKALLLCNDPFRAYNELVMAERPHIPQQANIHPSADIHPSAIIETNAVIGPHVVIGPGCRIEANAVVAEYSVLGESVLVQAGAIIGTEAFYFKKDKTGYERWRSGGRVVIGDRVDIGPGCTINKGVSSDTVIGEGTKLDSQVHIGHDVKVGRNCLFAAQVGIGGNTVIGDEVVLYGQVGIAQNLNIGDRVVILAKSGVSKDLEAGKVFFGYPAGEARAIYRELAALRHLPEFLKNFYK